MPDVLLVRSVLVLAGTALALWATWGLPRLMLAWLPARPLEAALAGLGAGCLIGVVALIVAFCPGRDAVTQVLLATAFVAIGASVWFGAWIRG